MRPRVLRGDRGSVTAEFAVALPAIGLVLLLGCGALAATSQQVRLQDAAADAARLAARGETIDRATAAVTAAVSGAAVAFDERGDVVCATATAAVGGPLPIVLQASSCALAGGG